MCFFFLQLGESEHGLGIRLYEETAIKFVRCDGGGGRDAYSGIYERETMPFIRFKVHQQALARWLGWLAGVKESGSGTADGR